MDRAEERRRVLEQLKPRRQRSKYRAVPTTYNGVRYASKAEAARAQELDMLLKAGVILDWIGQPTVRLGIAENVYRPDFLVIPVVGSPFYEDVKGYETAKFKRDKNLWKRCGRLELHVIRGGSVVQIIWPPKEIEP